VGEVRQREKHFKFKEKIFGQFFTPSEVADFIVSLSSLHLERKESGCDPACGDGVFLASMLKHGFNEVVGMDIDKNCVEAIPKNEKLKVLVGDALQRMRIDEVNPILRENYFDLVVGNPPFSAKYGRVKDRAILSSYQLGSGLKSQAIEVLFLERFIRLARNGGIIGIILPDGIFLNLHYKKVREFILNNCRVLAVVSLPRGIFNSSKTTTSKTSILFAMKGLKHEGDVFMADVKSLDELNYILELYKNHMSNSNAFWVKVTADSLHPKSYFKTELPKFRFPTSRLKELIDEMFCGSTEYGENRIFANNGIRFISAKVVTPLGIDFTKDERKFIEPGSPMDKKKAHVKIGDVLFVRVGVGCIGRAAVVVDEDDLGVADDWIYIIRVKKEKISPYYLAIFLQSKWGRIQVDNAKRGVGTVTIPQRLLKEVLVPIVSGQLQDELERKYRQMVEARRRGLYDEAESMFKEMVKCVEQEVCERQIELMRLRQTSLENNR
jgi:type I restriction enzyme M protein